MEVPAVGFWRLQRPACSHLRGALAACRALRCKEKGAANRQAASIEHQKDLRDTLLEDWLYWGIRVILFCFMQLRPAAQVWTDVFCAADPRVEHLRGKGKRRVDCEKAG